MAFTTWADHPSWQKANSHALDRRPKWVWDEQGDKKRTCDGPPPCCVRTFVAADMLVHYGTLAQPILDRIMARFPHLADVLRPDLYLCDSCRTTLLREGIITKEEAPKE